MLHDLNTLSDESYFHPTWRQPAMAALSDSSFDFYLTGSRYFHHERPDSDWDFMVQGDQPVFDYLIEQGFEQIVPGDIVGYDERDTLTKAVFQLYNVQVQLCTDVALKRKVRDCIMEHHAEYHRTLPNEERRRLWSDWGALLDRPNAAPTLDATPLVGAFDFLDDDLPF